MGTGEEKQLYLLPGDWLRAHRREFSYINEVRNPEPGYIVVWSDNRGRSFKFKNVFEPPQFDAYVVENTDNQDWLILDPYKEVVNGRKD